MVTIKKLIELNVEAERFIRAVENCLIRLEKIEESGYSYSGCKETGAVKRASMDLTRKLAELRKS